MSIFDFALPKTDKENILNEYKKNNIKNVVLFYEISKRNDLKIFKNIEEFKGLNIYLGALIDNDNPKKTIELAAELFYNKKLYNDLVVIKSKDFEYNRKVLEKYFHNGILNPGDYHEEDTLMFRYTSLSVASIKKLKKNNQAVFIGLVDILKNYKVLGRILYLVKILEKKDIPIIVGSFAKSPEEVPGKYELLSFKKILEIKYSNKLVFEAFILEQINRVRKAKNPMVITKGFEIVKTPYEDCREY